MRAESTGATVLVLLALCVLLVAGMIWAGSYYAIDAAQTHDSIKLSFYDESPGCGEAEHIGSGSCNSQIFEFGLSEIAATLFCGGFMAALVVGFILTLAGVMDMNT